jgi:hypothetical protein
MDGTPFEIFFQETSDATNMDKKAATFIQESTPTRGIES